MFSVAESSFSFLLTFLVYHFILHLAVSVCFQIRRQCTQILHRLYLLKRTMSTGARRVSYVVVPLYSTDLQHLWQTNVMNFVGSAYALLLRRLTFQFPFFEHQVDYLGVTYCLEKVLMDSNPISTANSSELIFVIKVKSLLLVLATHSHPVGKGDHYRHRKIVSSQLHSPAVLRDWLDHQLIAFWQLGNFSRFYVISLNLRTWTRIWNVASIIHNSFKNTFQSVLWQNADVHIIESF